MPYPFTKATTLGDFIATAIQFKPGTLLFTETLPPEMGGTVTRFLIVEDEGKKRMVTIPPGMKDQEFLTPSALRALCYSANLDPGLFGLDLN